MSDTLMPIFEGFVLFFITIFYLLLIKENLSEKVRTCSLLANQVQDSECSD